MNALLNAIPLKMVHYSRTPQPSRRNIQIAVANITEPDNLFRSASVQRVTRYLRNMGYLVLSELHIAAATAILSQSHPEAIDRPLSLQNEFVDENIAHEQTLLSLVKQLDIDKLGASISLKQKDDLAPDITLAAEEIDHWLTVNQESALTLLTKPLLRGKIRERIKHLLLKHSCLAILITDTIFNKKFSTLGFGNSEQCFHPHIRPYLDNIVYDQPLSDRILKDLIRENNALISKQTVAQQRLHTSDSQAKIFPTSPLPQHLLVNLLKHKVTQQIEQRTGQTELVIDPMDWRYQTLFRLTSFSAEQLFHLKDGPKAKKAITTYLTGLLTRNFQILPHKIDPLPTLNTELIDWVLDEQYAIITDRLKHSSLPLQKILDRKGPFAPGTEWEIAKTSTGIVMRERHGTASHRVKFKPVDSWLANQFHQDLHYIHTPRSHWAFGFFLEDEELPFSVLSVEPVDRDYKQEALLLFGYNPQHCLEFTRLYNWPGSPKNTTSAIFAETFAFFRQHYSYIEAAISTFMPTYSTGRSMITGGFSQPIYIKPNIHHFQPVESNGEICYEHVTHRRLKDSEVTIHSRLPLLPVVELIARMRGPSLDPTLVEGRDILAFTKTSGNYTIDLFKGHQL